MTAAMKQKKVTIEQYERLYFLLLLKETSRRTTGYRTNSGGASHTKGIYPASD
ncbi:hypothetical protein [uncultured Dialister sp.]|uniref:hypothetical protein n=1 Tax=uncultured Dialister sp. TaxID=278064 RepID=UPI0025E5342C|nr:hypothetical protein [uncultured Dialister sp.]